MPRGRKIKRYSVCRYCGKSIPTVHLKYHENKACRVMRGLDPAPENLTNVAQKKSDKEKTYTAKKGESIQDLLERVSKESKKIEPNTLD